MYVRPQSNIRHDGVRLPQNYGGSAFREPIIEQSEPPEDVPNEPAEQSMLRLEPSGDTAPLLKTGTHADAPSQKGQIGSEELLLLALALLLADSDIGGELVPLLVLLLFVK